MTVHHDFEAGSGHHVQARAREIPNPWLVDVIGGSERWVVITRWADGLDHGEGVEAA